MNDLELYREQLAECDDRIIDALVERNSIIEKIMAYKRSMGFQFYNHSRRRNSSARLKKNCRTIVMKKRSKMCSTVL